MWKIVGVISVMAMAPALPVQAQDIENGEKLFKRCAACHQVGGAAKNGAGPILTDVIGRTAGSVDGFNYSKWMRKAGDAGLVWDQDSIIEYIKHPTKYLRAYLGESKAKARMSFRLKKEEDRRDVVAYLATFSAAPDMGDDNADSTSEEGDKAQNLQDKTATMANALCVRNSNQISHFFAVETPGSERRVGTLGPGEVLCAEGTEGQVGVVSVFEHADELEGCSRLVAVGTTEDMLKYVDFDRCFWSSNT